MTGVPPFPGTAIFAARAASPSWLRLRRGELYLGDALFCEFQPARCVDVLPEFGDHRHLPQLRIFTQHKLKHKVLRRAKPCFGGWAIRDRQPWQTDHTRRTSGLAGNRSRPAGRGSNERHHRTAGSRSALIINLDPSG